MYEYYTAQYAEKLQTDVNMQQRAGRERRFIAVSAKIPNDRLTQW